MAKTKTLTHPKTGETLSLSQWASKLGINPASITYRTKKYKDLSIVLSPNRLPTQTGEWSSKEDRVLKSSYLAINFIEDYRARAKALGYKERTDRAILDRATTLQQKGELPLKKGNLQLCIDAGVLNFEQMAKCLSISPVTVNRFCQKGFLKYTISDQTHHRCIELRHFAKWATTPTGSNMLGKAIKQDEKAIAWVMEIIGKWLWIG
jgi:Mn-dependent DtxR family transcriptional regulator